MDAQSSAADNRPAVVSLVSFIFMLINITIGIYEKQCFHYRFKGIAARKTRFSAHLCVAGLKVLRTFLPRASPATSKRQSVSKPGLWRLSLTSGCPLMATWPAKGLCGPHTSIVGAITLMIGYGLIMTLILKFTWSFGSSGSECSRGNQPCSFLGRGKVSCIGVGMMVIIQYGLPSKLRVGSLW